jgi:hypothetical protein
LTGGQSVDSIEEDRLGLLSNHMVATFLELLAAMEYQKCGGRDRRVEFRCFPSFAGLTNSISPLKPVLVILGRVINNVSNGSFFIKRRCASRPTEFQRDRVPLASLEVSESCLYNVIEPNKNSARERSMCEMISFMLKSLENFWQWVVIAIHYISGQNMTVR